MQWSKDKTTNNDPQNTTHVLRKGKLFLLQNNNSNTMVTQRTHLTMTQTPNKNRKLDQEVKAVKNTSTESLIPQTAINNFTFYWYMYDISREIEHYNLITVAREIADLFVCYLDGRFHRDMFNWLLIKCVVSSHSG